MQLYLHKPLAAAITRDRVAQAAKAPRGGPPRKRRARIRVIAARALAASASRLDRETARRVAA